MLFALKKSLKFSRYMIEIAKCAGIPFTPDPNIMREDEVAAAEQMLIDFKNQGGVKFLSF